MNINIIFKILMSKAKKFVTQLIDIFKSQPLTIELKKKKKNCQDSRSFLIFFFLHVIIVLKYSRNIWIVELKLASLSNSWLSNYFEHYSSIVSFLYRVQCNLYNIKTFKDLNVNFVWEINTLESLLE